MVISVPHPTYSDLSWFYAAPSLRGKVVGSPFSRVVDLTAIEYAHSTALRYEACYQENTLS